MDLITVKNVNIIDVAASLADVQLPPATKRSFDFPVLNEWEMTLAGGGEGAVIWD